MTADTLIPRPDSETLVEGVLKQIADRDGPLSIVDIGTGTGCLLLALLSELPNASGLGVDISSAALSVARQNAHHLRLDHRCRFARGHYASMLTGGMDILIANPPYLAQQEVDTLDTEVCEFDPRLALVSGQTGLEAYQAIFEEVAGWQPRPRLMAFEFGYRQADAVCALAREYGLVSQEAHAMTILQDLGGRNRVLLLDKAQ